MFYMACIFIYLKSVVSDATSTIRCFKYWNYCFKRLKMEKQIVRITWILRKFWFKWSISNTLRTYHRRESCELLSEFRIAWWCVRSSVRLCAEFVEQILQLLVMGGLGASGGGSGGGATVVAVTKSHWTTMGKIVG